MKPEAFQEIHYNHAAKDKYLGDYASNRYRLVDSLFARYPAGKSILDIGCATGLLRRFTHQHRITGVDISPLLLECARRNGYDETAQIDVSNDDLPFEEASFDVIFCGECIEHVVDTDWLLCEANRVLKAGGDLVLTFPNIRTPVGLLMLLLGYPPMYASRYRSIHVRDFTLRTMTVALQNCGFGLQRAMGSDFHIPGLGDRFGWLARRLPALASTVVVLARKTKDVHYSLEEVMDPDLSVKGTGIWGRQHCKRKAVNAIS